MKTTRYKIEQDTFGELNVSVDAYYGAQTNLNEVIANRGDVLWERKFTDREKILSPNDDVDKYQSSSDTFSTAMHIATYKLLIESTIIETEKLRDTLRDKSLQFQYIIKTRRTHFMNAASIILRQEFSGYAAQLTHGLQAIDNSLMLVTTLNPKIGYNKAAEFRTRL